MPRKGFHINPISDLLRRYYQHLMVEARDFRDALRKKIEARSLSRSFDDAAITATTKAQAGAPFKDRADKER
jgi:hypothetical protein